MASSSPLAAIAALPMRQFRTSLRLLSGGLYTETARELLARRAACGGAVAADDVNT
jgi:hypothetical protein